MVYFVLSAILSFSFFAVVLLMTPPEYPLIPLPEPLKQYHPFFIAVGVFFLETFLIWLIFPIIKYKEFGETAGTLIASPQFTRGLLGFFFGAFFVLWIRRIWAVTDQSNIPFYLSMEGVLLLCLLLAGTQDAFKPFFQRISGVKLGLAELSFSAGAGDKTHRVRSSKTISTQEGGGQINGLSPVGLDILANLDRMMKIDYETYIPNIAKAEYEEIRAPNRWTQETQFKKPNTTHFVNTYVSPLAKCYKAIIEKTQNTELMDEAVQQLVHPFAEFAALSKNYPEEHTNVSDPLLKQLHGPIHNLTQMLATSIIQAKEFVKTIDLKPPTDPKQASCADLTNISVPGESINQSPSRAQANDLGDGLEKKLGDELQDDPEFVNRPYYALAYAAVASLYHLGSAAGFLELDEWAREGEAKAEQLMKAGTSSVEKRSHAGTENKKISKNFPSKCGSTPASV